MNQKEKMTYLQFLKVFIELRDAASDGAIFMLDNIYSSPEDAAFAWSFWEECCFERQDLFGGNGRKEVILINSHAL